MAACASRTTGGSRAPLESRPETPATPQLISTKTGPGLSDIYTLLQHLNQKMLAFKEHLTIVENMQIEQDESLSKLKEESKIQLEWLKGTNKAIQELREGHPSTPENACRKDADPTPCPSSSCPLVRVRSPSRSCSCESKPLGLSGLHRWDSPPPPPLRLPPTLTTPAPHRGLSHTPGRMSKPKIKEPDHFDGTRGKRATNWFLRVALWASHVQDLFGDEINLVTYVLGMTKDKAADWARPHINWAVKNQPGALRTMRDFAREFALAFEDPDAKRMATRKINKFTQTGDIKTYITEFENLEVELNWNKEALQAAFEKGLHWKVKEVLSQVYPAPPNFEEVKKHVQHIDATRHKNKASQPQQSNLKKPAATITATTTKTTKVALLDSPNYVSPEERDRRRKENLCIKCGSPNHQFKECRNGWSKERKEGKGKKKEETAKIAKAESEPESSPEN